MRSVRRAAAAGLVGLVTGLAGCGADTPAPAATAAGTIGPPASTSPTAEPAGPRPCDLLTDADARAVLGVTGAWDDTLDTKLSCLYSRRGQGTDPDKLIDLDLFVGADDVVFEARRKLYATGSGDRDISGLGDRAFAHIGKDALQGGDEARLMVLKSDRMILILVTAPTGTDVLAIATAAAKHALPRI